MMLSARGKWNYFAALLLAAALLSGIGMAQTKPKTQTLTGSVGDFLCGPKHTMFKDVSEKECTRQCMVMGSKYSLIVGEKVYELTGKESELEKFEGAKAKVTGTVDGIKVQVTAVSAP